MQGKGPCHCKGAPSQCGRPGTGIRIRRRGGTVMWCAVIVPVLSRLQRWGGRERDPVYLYLSLGERARTLTLDRCPGTSEPVASSATHSLCEFVYQWIVQPHAGVQASAWFPNKVSSLARCRILGRECLGWCYPTGRCAYLPSVICYGQSTKPPPHPLLLLLASVDVN